jgi:uncharacterized protein YkwD
VIDDVVRSSVHHHPAGPPLSARLTGALARGALVARRRGARVGLGVVLWAVVTSIVLAVPVVSGADGSPSAVGLDASTSSAFREPGSPVVMGLDGGAVASSWAADPGTPSVTPETTEAAPTEAAPTTEPDAPAPSPEAPVRSVSASGAGTSAPPVAAAALPPATTSVPAPAPAAASASAPSPGTNVEDEVLALVNAARADAGCAPLIVDPGLAAVAQAHSADMRDRNFFDHVNPDGLDPFERVKQAGETDSRAENIAHGQPTPAAVTAAWMDSSGHRANILDCELRTVGVGVAEGPGGPWWTQLFGV